VYVLDTNTLIHYFKGMGRVSERMLEVPPAEIGVPAVVVYELEVGIARASAAQKRREQLASFLDQVRLIPFGLTEARAAAGVRTAVEGSGRPIGPIETLIAGTALAGKSTLVSHNMREFERVPGLTVVDWY
jgi:tRNA(fMet)-specific endonuclease VapC